MPATQSRRKDTSEDLKGETHSFSNFSAAAAEAENSVDWSGNHFRFDVTAGDTQGRSVAQFIDHTWGAHSEAVLDLLTTDTEVWTAELGVTVGVRSGARA